MPTVARIRITRTLKKTTTTMSATVCNARLPVSSADGVSVGCNTVELDGVGSCRSWLMRVFTTSESLNSLSITSLKFPI